MKKMAPVKPVYVYDIPYAERRDLCRILDQNNKWADLAADMQYDISTIQTIKYQVCRELSPTDQLLDLWGTQNHTILELFVLLSRRHEYQAMTKIKKFVDMKYHRLIVDGEQNPDILIGRLKLNGCKPEDNFDSNEKILNVPKPLEQKIDQAKVERGVMVSCEDNENPRMVHMQRMLGARASTVDMSSRVDPVITIPRIPYEELQKSTNNWNPVNILGKGGFGTVFKGNWKCTPVAIKRIEEKNDPDARHIQFQQWITELQCLNAYRHDNILPLYACSLEGPQPCLVYQYMPGGCLERRLRVRDSEKVLKWPTRLSIAIGTARGLQFLHTIGEKPLIHGDVKSANILLDTSDMPKIGDFGLAREGPGAEYTHIMLQKIHGTRPYLPDEFLRAKKFSTKVDTYSFGVVLFELATSLPVYSKQRTRQFLKDHVVEHEGDVGELKDAKAEGGEGVFEGLLSIGKVCVSSSPKERPEMVEVLIRLEEVGS